MKKIITSIILACMLCFPMMVSAYSVQTEVDGVVKTCEIIENYYFLLEEPASTDKGATVEGGVFTNSTNYDATYDNTVNDVVHTKELIYKEDDLNNYSYHKRLFAALDNYYDTNGDTEYKVDNDTYYYLQNTFRGTGGTGDLPFFADSYLMLTSSSEKTTFKNAVKNSYVYIEGEYCTNCSISATQTRTNNSIKLNVLKNYRIPAARYNDTYTTFYNTPNNSEMPGPWYTVNNSYSIVYIPALYKIESYDPTKCDAIEEETEYTITYDPNEGTGEIMPYPVEVTEGDSHSVINNNNVTKYTREGYKFLGWSTDKNATSATYTAGNSITPTSNMTLYAIWQKIDDSAPTHTITYYENAGNDVKNEDDDLKHGESYKIMSGDIYTREGYKFLGWSTDKDATKADDNYSPNTVITVDKDLNLYAVWLKEGNKEEGEIGKHGLGYSIGLIGTILAGTGAGVVYFKKRNKFENI